MAEKKIIELNQTGDRIKTILDDVDSTYSATKTNASNALNKVTSLEGTIKDINTTLGSQQTTLAGHETKISHLESITAQYDLTYVDDVLTLWREQDGVRTSAGSATIVSASDVVSSVITVERITPASTTVTLDEPGVLEYRVTSEQAGAETGDLTVTWKVNNVTVLVETVEQGQNEFKLAGYVTAGNNSVTATFVDTIGTSYTAHWSVDVINMYITSTLNDTITYAGDVNVSFTAFGALKKTIYFILDGEEFYQTDIVTSGIQSSHIIPHQPHGAHSLEIYCKATMNTGREIESTHLYYDIMFIDADNDTPIIRWPYNGAPLTQFTATTFNYIIYVPNALTADAQLLINDEVISNVTVDRTQQEWVYKPQTYGEDVSFSIKTGDVIKTKVLDINKFPYDVEPVAGAAIDFNPTGRSNNDSNYSEWTDGTYSMTVSEGFDWNNGGWKVDDKGDSYFCVKAGSTMTINYPLFESAEDVKTTGKNFKIIFKTTNNKKIKDNVIKCLSSKAVVDEEGVSTTSYIGLDAGTQEASIYGATAQLEVQYVEDEKLELEFNIYPNEERNNFMLAYINADPVRVTTYAESAVFNQSLYEGAGKFQPITFGSESCDVHIYRFKAYNTYLSDKAIMQNYIADATNSDDMVVRYERNEILDESGENLDYNKLSKLYPDLRIILITCPRFTFDKDDKVKHCTVQHLMGNGDPKHNWTAEDVQVKGQGTSSNEYGTSARNIDIKLNKYEIEVPGVDEEGKPTTVKKEIAFTYADGSHDKKYAMTENSIAVNYFNIKVNVASSENANNARLAERFFKFNPYVRQARIDNPKVRDTMEFHPCVIFLKELGTDEEYGNQEFPADGQFHFYACGDFGNSKKNHEAFGMNVKVYDDYNKAAKETANPVDADGQPLAMPTECIIEISNNTSPGCLFKITPGWSEILPDTAITVDETGKETEVDVWGGDVVEFRYPEDLFDIIENEKNEFTATQVEAANNIFNHLKGQVRRLWNWVAATDRTTATNELLPAPVTYNGVEYTIDNVEYRKAKFINEYLEYFEPNSLFYNYIFTDRYLMVDNRAKNVFIHTVDGIKWDFCFDYDNDTSLGCDNRGGLKFDYYYEDTDEVNNEMVFNASESVLWTNVRDYLFDRLVATYKATTFHTASGTLKDFNDYQWLKPERLQMFDMRRKYLRPYSEGHYGSNQKAGSVQSYGQYLPMLNGRKTYQRQAFEKYREAYMNSKYQVVSDSESLQFRATTKENEQPLTITPYCWLYVQVDFDGTPTPTVRTPAGQPREVKVPMAQGKLEDKNTHIYHPRWLAAVDGLDQFYIRDANFDYGVKLSRLILGSMDDGYSNKKLETNLSISGASLLEELNICGWSADNIWSLNLSKNTNLKKLDTRNSNMTSVTFANGGLLEEARLNGVSAIYAQNLKNLHTFTLSSYARLEQARLENSPIITTTDFISQCTNLAALRLTGIDWTVDNTELLTKLSKLQGLSEQSSLVSQSVVAGNVWTAQIYESDLKKYNEIWPSLTIDYPEGGLIAQYKVIYYDWDQTTILYETYVTLNELPIDPVEQELIPVPTRESTISTAYTYKGWKGDFTTPIISSRSFVAEYSETTRKYTVTWWKDRVNGTKLHSQEYEYGSEAIFVDTNNELAPQPDTIRNSYNLFKGWDKSTGYVTGNIDVIAQWENGYVAENLYPEDTKQWTAAQVYTVTQRGEIMNYFGEEDMGAIVPNGDRISIQLGRSYDYSNLEKQVLIAEPMSFDGATCIDTGIALMAEDRDWTLMIDAQFNKSATGSVLASCFLNTRSAGFQLLNSSEYEGSATPYIKWGTDSKLANRSYGWGREIFVLQHKKGSLSIDVYVGCLDELEPQKIELTKATDSSHDMTLVFGAQKNVNGTIGNYAKGIVYRCELWYGLLGEQECKDLAWWPHDIAEFDVVSFGDYSTDQRGSYPTKIDFFASQLTWAKIAMYKNFNGNVYGFHNSYLKEWLNTRFLKALPIDWQKVISSPYIYSTTLDKTSEVVDIDAQPTSIWIPAVVEMMRSDTIASTEPWSSEGIHKPIYPSQESRRFGKGVPTPELFSTSASWYYSSVTDPAIGRELINGSVWYNPSSFIYSIYSYGQWFQWGHEQLLRSAGNSVNAPIRSLSSTGGWIASGSGSVYSVLPCFSI